MPHALAVRHVVVDDEERVAYLARLAERRASAAACGVHFWAFEHEAGGGRFLEFIETRDRASLGTALDQDALFAETLDFRLAPTRAEAEARTDVYLELASHTIP
ncbi:MAG: hypothetical protein JO180_05255 [Gemmatirosa sp.]|nr:hypothetical protein [Gemmatirosa sp.]